MPIEFRQPSPVSAAASIGAGRADINTKEFSALAGLVESYGRLAAQAYGRGGGGGGRGGEGSSGGNVQVLPTSDYGANAQVQQEANREQRAMDLGFGEDQANQRLAYSLAPENDPVARHIQMQESYADRRQIQAQQANEQAKQRAITGLVGPQGQVQPGPTPQPVQPTPSWEIQDDQDLATQKQIVRKAAQDEAAGKLSDPDAIQAIQGAAMSKIHDLQARKDAATQYQQNKAQEEQSRAQEMLVGQQDRLALETRKVFRMHGSDGMIDKFDPKTGEYVGSLQWNPKTQTMEAIKGLEPKKAAAAEKEEKPQTDSQLMKEAKAHAESVVPFNKDTAIHAAAIAEATQKQFTELKAQQQAKVDARDTDKRMKEADPRAVQAYTTFTSAIPRNDAGQVDLNRASLQQLQVLDKALQNPKRLGMTVQDAAKKTVLIRQAIQARLSPPAKPIETPAPQTATQGINPGGGGALNYASPYGSFSPSPGHPGPRIGNLSDFWK